MDNIPDSKEEVALWKFMLTALYTGLILIRSTTHDCKSDVDEAEKCAEEVLSRIPKQIK